jgi:hypothetical protein
MILSVNEIGDLLWLDDKPVGWWTESNLGVSFSFSNSLKSKKSLSTAARQYLLRAYSPTWNLPKRRKISFLAAAQWRVRIGLDLPARG